MLSNEDIIEYKTFLLKFGKFLDPAYVHSCLSVIYVSRLLLQKSLNFLENSHICLLTGISCIFFVVYCASSSYTGTIAANRSELIGFVPILQFEYKNLNFSLKIRIF